MPISPARPRARSAPRARRGGRPVRGPARAPAPRPAAARCREGASFFMRWCASRISTSKPSPSTARQLRGDAGSPGSRPRTCWAPRRWESLRARSASAAPLPGVKPGGADHQRARPPRRRRARGASAGLRAGEVDTTSAWRLCERARPGRPRTITSERRAQPGHQPRVLTDQRAARALGAAHHARSLACLDQAHERAAHAAGDAGDDGAGMVHVPVAAQQPSRSARPSACAAFASLIGTSGSRISGPNMPIRCSAHFTGMGLDSTKSSRCSGVQLAPGARAPSRGRRSRAAATRSAIMRGRHVGGDGDDALAAAGDEGQHGEVVAGEERQPVAALLQQVHRARQLPVASFSATTSGQVAQPLQPSPAAGPRRCGRARCRRSSGKPGCALAMAR